MNAYREPTVQKMDLNRIKYLSLGPLPTHLPFGSFLCSKK